MTTATTRRRQRAIAERRADAAVARAVACMRIELALCDLIDTAPARVYTRLLGAYKRPATDASFYRVAHLIERAHADYR